MSLPQIDLAAEARLLLGPQFQNASAQVGHQHLRFGTARQAIAFCMEMLAERGRGSALTVGSAVYSYGDMLVAYGGPTFGPKAAGSL